jgi:hypothetical protein
MVIEEEESSSIQSFDEKKKDPKVRAIMTQSTSSPIRVSHFVNEMMFDSTGSAQIQSKMPSAATTQPSSPRTAHKKI